jgi:hypothetical protein
VSTACVLVTLVVFDERDAAALGAVDRDCPPGLASSVLQPGLVWQQEIRSGTMGQLARIALTFIGPVDGATVRIRRGPGPSREPAFFETVVHLDVAGTQTVSLDVTHAQIMLRPGEVLVAEIEGAQPRGRGGLVGTTTRTAACDGLVFQNGSREGISPDLFVSY